MNLNDIERVRILAGARRAADRAFREWQVRKVLNNVLVSNAGPMRRGTTRENRGQRRARERSN